MKANQRKEHESERLINFFLMTAAISISGCYTQFSAPIARQEFYEQRSRYHFPGGTNLRQLYFRSSSLSEYRLGYRDGQWGFDEQPSLVRYNAVLAILSWLSLSLSILGYYDPGITILSGAGIAY
jgi:hypothetical protein